MRRFVAIVLLALLPLQLAAAIAAEVSCASPAQLTALDNGDGPSSDTACADEPGAAQCDTDCVCLLACAGCVTSTSQSVMTQVYVGVYRQTTLADPAQRSLPPPHRPPIASPV